MVDIFQQSTVGRYNLKINAPSNWLDVGFKDLYDVPDNFLKLSVHPSDAWKAHCRFVSFVNVRNVTNYY